MEEIKKEAGVKLDVNQLVEELKSNIEKLAHEKSSYEKERIEAFGNLIDKCLSFVKDTEIQEKDFEKELLQDIKEKQERISENYRREIDRILKDRDLLFKYALVKRDYKIILDETSQEPKIEEKTKAEKFWLEIFNIKHLMWLISTLVLSGFAIKTLSYFTSEHWASFVPFGLCLVSFVLFQIIYLFKLTGDDY